MAKHVCFHCEGSGEVNKYMGWHGRYVCTHCQGLGVHDDGQREPKREYLIFRVCPIENLNGAMIGHEARPLNEMTYTQPLLAYRLAGRLNRQEDLDGGDNYYVVVPVGGSAFSHAWSPVPRPPSDGWDDMPF